jgi:hypothetical protein
VSAHVYSRVPVERAEGGWSDEYSAYSAYSADQKTVEVRCGEVRWAREVGR